MDSMTGFPPDEDSRVTVANWQDPESVRWAFRHMREIIPSQVIPAGPAPAALPPRGDADFAGVSVHRLSGAQSSVEDVFDETSTDALIVLHDGVLLTERYYAGTNPATPHLLMSVSKSLVGCVAGILADRGTLDVTAPVEQYVPEVADSGYGGATVRDLLDMRTGVQFRETYDMPDAEVRVMERSMGWSPRLEGDPVGAYAYLASLERAEPHGGTFTYRSADTDMLGWVCERAAGTRMADLVSALLWQPMGAEADAEITCDSVGTGIHDGGISAVARDLARFGRLLIEDGKARRPRGHPGGLARGRLAPPRRRQGRVRRHGQRRGAARGVVPQPVLVRAETARGGAALPRHPRSDGLRQPRDPTGRRQAVVVADPSAHAVARRHPPGLRRDRRRARD